MSLTPNRIYAQYRNQPKAVAWYGIVPKLSGDITKCASVVRNMYDIDANVGAQLDIIGRIVVQSREFTGKIELHPGLFDLSEGCEFGDEDNAIFASLTVDQDSKMSNELYRLAIKAKILKNNSDATIESILDGMNLLFPNAEVLRVTDGEDMSFSVEFYGIITELERWALRNASFVPKPQGVRFNGFLEGVGLAEFGDVDSEFGDDGAEFVGFTGV
ncbi:structural protein [Edwardsiella phage PEi21]|uniref:DUF2612 domain-containing protein n=1 Tax=Edwardsiella phage PEi21 TaxID=1325372 RepID=N0DSE2_9CAUD|nr:structural protein [Edwardsiella phage PEi21]BAN16853.1 hypothetical protein [Edwardsiella phage PEi21]